MSHPEQAGRFVKQSTCYRAFQPASLPPTAPIAYEGELQTLRSTADRDLARLDAIASLLPNPDLFVAMYVRHEAVLSSQIEGTQTKLEDVLASRPTPCATIRPRTWRRSEPAPLV